MEFLKTLSIMFLKIALIAALFLSFAAGGFYFLYNVLGPDYFILKFIVIMIPYMSAVNKFILFPLENRLGVRSVQNKSPLS